jgi:hypothetical protein
MAKTISNKQLCQIILGVTIASLSVVESTEARPDLGYQNHEHVFMEKAYNLKSMSQEKADSTCGSNWEYLSRLRPNYEKFRPYVWHIWAHRNNGHCVANHNAWGKFNSYTGETWIVNGKRFTVWFPLLRVQ